ncbi:hypothetical protein FJ941_02505 [Mesorhizobium sp. B2-3-13]|uniref:hypothetical protein n=1 Tax=Mesorhizobium sp. B2-3-13 TaxID=2589951 RepID=UPI001128ABDB|nr:hypothetical protein [Mesorhizobium sp. B2-3-13]TPL89707.1 hypothetical protein FJ941_02505 [Mesorhizobium sp. B2-3-13]
MQSPILKTLLSFVGIPLALFGPILGASMAYWMHNLGPVTPKKLDVSFWGVSDPLEDLKTEDAKIIVVATSNGANLENLRIGQAVLTNNGLSPILPSEQYEPVRISSKAPWKIVNVVSSDKGVALSWTKVDDYNFVSEAALLNPSDNVFLTLYFTKPGPYTKKTDEDKPILSWKARIANLDEISNSPDPFKKLENITWLLIFHDGPSTVFLVGLFLLYLFISLILLRMSGLFSKSSLIAYGSVLTMATINLCAAEAGATYTFGMFPFGNSPDNWVNIPPIALNGFAFVGLFIYSRKSSP